MQKLEGVDKVTVSLKDGLTILELKAGNTVTLAKLRSIIKNNGFVSKNAEIIAQGSLAATGDFDVAGTRERLPVAGKALVDTQNNWRLTSPAK